MKISAFAWKKSALQREVCEQDPDTAPGAQKRQRNRARMCLWFYTLEADPVAVTRNNVKSWENAERGTFEPRPEQIDGNTLT